MSSLWKRLHRGADPFGTLVAGQVAVAAGAALAGGAQGDLGRLDRGGGPGVGHADGVAAAAPTTCTAVAAWATIAALAAGLEAGDPHVAPSATAGSGCSSRL